MKYEFANSGINVTISEYKTFYLIEIQGNGIPASTTVQINFTGGLSIKTPSSGFFTLPPVSGNGGTLTQSVKCYSNSIRLLASSIPLNPTSYGGGFIPKL